jgi:uncharacterized RDD family membrane protein YckC
MNDKKNSRFPHLARDPLIVGKLSANASNRLWAKSLDFSLVLVISFFFSFFSNWFAILSIPFLWVSMEQFGRGQSPGKWLLGLHVIDTYNGKKPGVYSCFIRNLPLVLLMMIFYTPLPLRIFWETCLLFCLLCECYFILKLKTGIRVGDILGSTRVFDYKDEHTLFIEQLLKEEKA